MTLANLKEELRLNAHAQAEEIMRKAREQAKDERHSAELESRKIVDSSKADALQYTAKERMRVSAANIRARRIVQDAQYGLVNEAVQELRLQLSKSASDRKKYKPLFERLARDALENAGKDSVLAANKEDYPLLKAIGKASKDALECAGGVAAFSADGRVKIDNTFEALLEEKDEQIRRKAYELLFQ